MNATPSRSFPPVHSLPRGDDGTGGAPKSRAKVLHQSSGVGPRASDLAAGAAHARARALAKAKPEGEGILPLAAAGFRDWFVPAFARWLQVNFDNPEHVARAFGVRNTTADNWWNGRHCLTGDMAGIVFLTFPAAAGWFLAEWEGR